MGASLAQAETLKCKLHISEPTKESSALVAPPNAGVSLSAIRYSGICIFADGRIAEKQFVVINRIIGDGNFFKTSGSKTTSFLDVTLNVE